MKQTSLKKSWLLLLTIGLCLMACNPVNPDNPDTPSSGNAVISPKGGTVNLTGGISIIVPEGAVDSDVPVSADYIASNKDFNHNESPLPALAAAVEFGPEGVTFEKPVTIQIPYNGQLHYPSLAVLYYEPEDSVWSFVGEAKPVGDKLEFQVTHFSVYGVSDGIPGNIEEIANSFTESLKHPGISDVEVDAAMIQLCDYLANDLGLVNGPKMKEPDFNAEYWIDCCKAIEAIDAHWGYSNTEMGVDVEGYGGTPNSSDITHDKVGYYSTTEISIDFDYQKSDVVPSPDGPVVTEIQKLDQMAISFKWMPTEFDMDFTEVPTQVRKDESFFVQVNISCGGEPIANQAVKAVPDEHFRLEGEDIMLTEEGGYAIFCFTAIDNGCGSIKFQSVDNSTRQIVVTKNVEVCVGQNDWHVMLTLTEDFSCEATVENAVIFIGDDYSLTGGKQSIHYKAVIDGWLTEKDTSYRFVDEEDGINEMINVKMLIGYGTLTNIQDAFSYSLPNFAAHSSIDIYGNGGLIETLDGTASFSVDPQFTDYDYIPIMGYVVEQYPGAEGPQCMILVGATEQELYNSVILTDENTSGGSIYDAMEDYKRYVCFEPNITYKYHELIKVGTETSKDESDEYMLGKFSDPDGKGLFVSTSFFIPEHFIVPFAEGTYSVNPVYGHPLKSAVCNYPSNPGAWLPADIVQDNSKLEIILMRDEISLE